MTDLYSQPTFVPGGRLKNAVVALFATVIVLNVLSIAAGFLQYALLSKLEAGAQIDETTLAFNDMTQGCIALLVLGVQIALVVAFCMWFYRAHKNLVALEAENLEYTPARAVWGFFIPLANLFWPYLAAKEIYLKSDPVVDRDVTEPQKAPLILRVWWLLFLLSNVTGNLAGARWLDPESLSDMKLATVFGSVNSLVTIFAALAAVKVVKLIDRRQRERHSVLAFS